MKKVLKILGIIVVLFIAALFILPIVFKDDIVKLVKKEANEAVNAKIDFGDFSLSLIKSFPDFHFTIEDVDVEGIDEFEGVKLAHVEKLSLIVDIMSVIKGESINIKKIAIETPYIEMKVLEDGKANYDIAKESDEAEEVSNVEEESSFKLELKSLSISNGRFIFDDATMPMLMDIQGLNIGLSGDMTADVTNIDTKGSIESFDLTFDGMRLMNRVVVALEAIVEMDLNHFKFTFKDNRIMVNQLPLALDGWLEMPDEAIDMDLTFSALESDFKTILSLVPAEFTQDLEGVNTSGTLALQGYAKGTFLDEVYPAFGIDLQINNARFQYPDLPKSVDNIQIAASVENKSGDLDETIVDVPKFHLEMAGNPFDMTFYLATPMSDPYIKAGMKGKVDLSNIKDIIPLDPDEKMRGVFTADIALAGKLSTIENEQYEEFKAEGSLLAENFHYSSDSLDYPIDMKQAKLSFSPQFVALDDMQLQLGESDLQLDGRLENFIAYALKDKEILKGELAIHSTLMNINELAGLDAEDESSEQEEETSEEPMEALILPKYIDFTMTAAMKKVIFDDIIMENMGGKITLKEQKLEMINTGMELLKGNMTLNGFYETTNPSNPTYDLTMDVSDFDVKQTVETFNTVDKLVPLAKHTSGEYGAKLKVKGTLDKNMDPVYETIFGEGQMKTRGVTVKDYKPFEKIAKAIRYDALNPMELNDLDIDFTISEGKIHVYPFTYKVGNTKITIAGTNSLDQTIDYTFSFQIPRKELGSTANQAADGLLAKAAEKGINLELAEMINVDVQLVGPATNPSIKTDLKESASKATDAIKDKAKEAFDQKKKEAEERARQEMEAKKKELEAKKKEAEAKAKEELEKKKQKAQEEIDRKKKEAEEELERQKQKAKEKAEEEKKAAEKKAKEKIKGLFD